MNTLLRQNLSLLFLLPAFALASVMQSGRVRLQSSGSKPLAGVQIQFRSANDAVSDDKGLFSLEFPRKSPGDQIYCTKVARTGYEWVNEKEYRDRVASGTVPLDIVMCPAGKLAENRERFFQVAMTARQKAVEEKLRDLQKKVHDQALLERARDSLEDLADKQRSNMREMADQFALLNTDDFNDLHRRAFDLFQGGEIDSAIALMESANLLAQVDARVSRRDSLAKLVTENDKSIKQLAQELVFQAQLYVTNWDYEKAAVTYDKLLLLDSNNVENLSTVEGFYQNTWKNYGKWESLSRRILSLMAPVWMRTNASLNLGDMYSELGKLDSAGRWFGEYHRLGDSLYRADTTVEWNKQPLSISLERLGSWYQTQGDLAKALEFFSKVLGISEELYRNNPKDEGLKKNLAISYSKLGDLYQSQGDFAKALEYFSKSTQYMEELYRDNPKNESLKHGLAISYGKLGGVYQSSGDLPKALEAYRKAVVLSGELFQRNPTIPEYATNWAWYLKTTGVLVCQLGPKADGIAFQQRAADLYDSLYRVSGTLWQLASTGEVYANLSRCTDSTYSKIVYLHKAQERQRTVFQKDTSTAWPLIATNGSLSWNLLLVRQFLQSDSAARAALSLAKAHNLEPSAQWIRTNLAHALLFQGRYAEAEAIYRDLKDRSYPQDTTKTFTSVLLDDFAALEKAGITSPDVAKIRAMLVTSGVKPEPASATQQKGNP